MNDNINTREYWDERFGSGDWDDKRGRAHSRAYARTFIDHWHIPAGFDGQGSGKRGFSNAAFLGDDRKCFHGTPDATNLTCIHSNTYRCLRLWSYSLGPRRGL